MVENELLAALSDLLDTKLEPIRREICGLGNRLTGVEERLTGVEERLTSVEERLTSAEERLTSVEERLTSLEGRVTGLESDIADIKQKIASLEITIESETNKNIRIVAEGHLDINRKLDEAIKASYDNDIYKMKVNMLDAEIKRIALGQKVVRM